MDLSIRTLLSVAQQFSGYFNISCVFIIALIELNRYRVDCEYCTQYFVL